MSVRRRLDQEMLRRGLAESRTRAQDLIDAGGAHFRCRAYITW